MKSLKININIDNCFYFLNEYSKTTDKKTKNPNITENGIKRIKKFIVDYIGDKYLDPVHLKTYLNQNIDLVKKRLQDDIKAKLIKSLEKINQVGCGQPYLSNILKTINFKVELFPDKKNDHNYGSFQFKNNQSIICVRNPDDDTSILHEIIHASCHANAINLKTIIKESDDLDIFEEFILFLKKLLLNYKENNKESQDILEQYIVNIEKNIDQYIKKNITLTEQNKIIKIINLEHTNAYEKFKIEKEKLNADELKQFSIIELKHKIKCHMESVKNENLYQKQENKTEMIEELLCRIAEIHYEIRAKKELRDIKSDILPQDNNNIPKVIDNANLINLIDLNGSAVVNRK